MGLGDQLMATGMARGARARGKRIAFGDGRKIRWDANSEAIFRGNPNIAPPGSERRPDLEWVPYFKGSRLYNTHDTRNNRWLWSETFRAIPGELYFSDGEIKAGERHGAGFIVIEPSVPGWKSAAVNKDWGRARYQAVADRLAAEGLRVVQFVHGGGAALDGVEAIPTAGFREACAILRQAALFIGPEGGMHHAAAALGIKGVVIFGGFIPPSVTGYALHENLTGGAEACGSLAPCRHCREALAAITTDQVLEAARKQLSMDKMVAPGGTYSVQRRVAGYHDIRMDGMVDLVARARGTSVFDIGCNRGMVGFEFASNGAKVVHGCDLYELGIQTAREVFADLRSVESKFEVCDLTAGPAALRAFGGRSYDITLCLATYHKLKRVMAAEDLSVLMRDFGKRTGRWFAWRGTSEAAKENDAEIEALDADLGAVGLARIHTSYMSEELGVAAIWRRS